MISRYNADGEKRRKDRSGEMGEREREYIGEQVGLRTAMAQAACKPTIQ
jgi:hypothetical protein